MSHTPGPWHVGMRNGHNANNVMAFNGKDWAHDQSICLVYGIWNNKSVDEVRGCEGLPNARLIAAAPDLLAACEKAQDALCERFLKDRVLRGADAAALDAINEAIAKAKGKA